MKWLLAPVLVASFLGGCIGGGDVPAPEHTTTYHVAPGAALSLDLGTVAEYVVTSPAPNTYRIVWTGDLNTSGAAREFTGSIWTTGHFTSVSPGCSGACPLESNDFVSSEPIAVPHGERIDFDTFATSASDGVDVVTDGASVTVDCAIDGLRHPEFVFFASAAQGGQAATVNAVPFAITDQ